MIFMIAPAARRAVMYKNIILLIVITMFILPGSMCADNESDYESRREHMVELQIRERGIRDPRVLDALRKVPRHLFVPEQQRSQAYIDSPLPIGLGQTISQPYIVAYMTEQLMLDGSEKVLEIGTGSGYQAAILGELAQEVYSVEIIPDLGKRAQTTLGELGYDNIHIRIGDGFQGWEEHAPYDAIIVTAAPENIPQALIDQLAEGGRMIIPVGPTGGIQELVLGIKEDGKFTRKNVLSVRFVPMVRDRK